MTRPTELQHTQVTKPARQYFRFQAGENGAKETNKSASQQLVNNKSTTSQQLVNNKSTTSKQQQQETPQRCSLAAERRRLS